MDVAVVGGAPPLAVSRTRDLSDVVAGRCMRAPRRHRAWCARRCAGVRRGRRGPPPWSLPGEDVVNDDRPRSHIDWTRSDARGVCLELPGLVALGQVRGPVAPQLAGLLACGCGGDTSIVVWRLDRLGRSLSHIVRTIEDLPGRAVVTSSHAYHSALPLSRLCAHQGRRCRDQWPSPGSQESPETATYCNVRRDQRGYRKQPCPRTLTLGNSAEFCCSD